MSGRPRTPGPQGRRSGHTALLCAVAVALSAWLLVVSPGSADLAGSKHDFTDDAWSGGSACAACHVPHRSGQPKKPKWGRPLRIDPAARPADRDEPGGRSRLCLSCHDGNSAGDIFGAEVAQTMSERSRIGAHGDLSNDHPIGVRYPVGDREYQPLSRVEQGGRIRLFDNRIECSSCHDPHNSYDLPHMLVMPNDESQLCTACHRL